MPLMTPVELPERRLQITPQTRLVLLGSCFATHIGARLRGAGLRTEVNPFGVLYNPESIALAVDALLDGDVKENWFFYGRDNLWHSWLHSTEYSAPDKDACLKRVEERFTAAREMLLQADVVCFTFGTNRVYEYEGRVVGNCHKQPAAQFKERQLGIAEIVTRWRTLLKRLHEANPKLQVLFTVSPYRYAKYGFVENQRAKATLLLAVEQLVNEERLTVNGERLTVNGERLTVNEERLTVNGERLTGGGMPNVSYFPAYEILLDELRDYRFYAEDMLHPSEQAVTYIWQRFTSWAFTPEAVKLTQEWERTERDLAHRPLNPDSEAHKAFLKKVLERREHLKLLFLDN